MHAILMNPEPDAMFNVSDLQWLASLHVPGCELNCNSRKHRLQDLGCPNDGTSNATMSVGTTISGNLALEPELSRTASRSVRRHMGPRRELGVNAN